MAAITLAATQTKSVTTLLSAVSANAAIDYGALKINTVQTPVTAYVVGMEFVNPNPYPPEGPIFVFTCNALSALPTPVPISSSTGVYTIAATLSATTGEGELGQFTGILNLTLSATCVSGVSATPTAVDTTTLSVALSTLSLTALNFPFGGQLCLDQFRRQRLLGNI